MNAILEKYEADALKIRKNNAKSVWAQGGLKMLAKAMASEMAPDPGRNIGYCTTLQALLGLTPAQIERQIGLRVGSKLVGGAVIYIVTGELEHADFNLRGYTQTPAGLSTSSAEYQEWDDQTKLDYPPGTGVPQWEILAPQSRLKKVGEVAAGEKLTRDMLTL
ncbi:MAG: hypothetical protein AAGD13_10770 [Pseudomonadota bacterium]